MSRFRQWWVERRLLWESLFRCNDRGKRLEPSMRKELSTLLFLLAAISAKGQTLTVRATFDTPFAYNYPPPVTGPDGNLYGTSGTGIYRVTPAGAVSTIYT